MRSRHQQPTIDELTSRLIDHAGFYTGLDFTQIRKLIRHYCKTSTLYFGSQNASSPRDSHGDVDENAVRTICRRLASDADFHIENEGDELSIGISLQLFDSPNLDKVFEDLRLVPSENRVWKSIAGHDINYKLLQSDRFELLKIIAAAGPVGISSWDLQTVSERHMRFVGIVVGCLVRGNYAFKVRIPHAGDSKQVFHVRFRDAAERFGRTPDEDSEDEPDTGYRQSNVTHAAPTPKPKATPRQALMPIEGAPERSDLRRASMRVTGSNASPRFPVSLTTLPSELHSASPSAPPIGTSAESEAQVVRAVKREPVDSPVLRTPALRQLPVSQQEVPQASPESGLNKRRAEDADVHTPSLTVSSDSQPNKRRRKQTSKGASWRDSLNTVEAHLTDLDIARQSELRSAEVPVWVRRLPATHSTRLEKLDQLYRERKLDLSHPGAYLFHPIYYIDQPKLGSGRPTKKLVLLIKSKTLVSLPSFSRPSEADRMGPATVTESILDRIAIEPKDSLQSQSLILVIKSSKLSKPVQRPVDAVPTRQPPVTKNQELEVSTAAEFNKAIDRSVMPHGMNVWNPPRSVETFDLERSWWGEVWDEENNRWRVLDTPAQPPNAAVAKLINEPPPDDRYTSPPPLPAPQFEKMSSRYTSPQQEQDLIMKYVKANGGIFPGNGELWYPYASEVRATRGSLPHKDTVARMCDQLVEQKLLKSSTFVVPKPGQVSHGRVLHLPEIREHDRRVVECVLDIKRSYPELAIPTRTVHVAPDLLAEVERTLGKKRLAQTENPEQRPGKASRPEQSTTSSPVAARSSLAAQGDVAHSGTPIPGALPPGPSSSQAVVQTATQKLGFARSTTSATTGAEPRPSRDVEVKLSSGQQPPDDRLATAVLNSPAGEILSQASKQPRIAGLVETPPNNTRARPPSLLTTTRSAAPSKTPVTFTWVEDDLSIDAHNEETRREKELEFGGSHPSAGGPMREARPLLDPHAWMTSWSSRTCTNAQRMPCVRRIATLTDPDQASHSSSGTFATNFAVFRSIRPNLKVDTNLQSAFEASLPADLHDIVNQGKMRKKDSLSAFEQSLKAVGAWEVRNAETLTSSKSLMVPRFINHFAAQAEPGAKEPSNTTAVANSPPSVIPTPLPSVTSTPPAALQGPTPKVPAQPPFQNAGPPKQSQTSSQISRAKNQGSEASALDNRRQVPVALAPARVPLDRSYKERMMDQDFTNKLIITVIAVRTLLPLTGGRIAWNAVCKSVKDIPQSTLVSRWGQLQKTDEEVITYMQKEFEEEYLKALTKGELKSLDYDEIHIDIDSSKTTYFKLMLTVAWAKSKLQKTLTIAQELLSFDKSLGHPIHLPDSRETLDKDFEIRSVGMRAWQSSKGSTSKAATPAQSLVNVDQPQVSDEPRVDSPAPVENTGNITDTSLNTNDTSFDVHDTTFVAIGTSLDPDDKRLKLLTLVRANVLCPLSLYDPKAAEALLSRYPDSTLYPIITELKSKGVIQTRNSSRYSTANAKSKLTVQSAIALGSNGEHFDARHYIPNPSLLNLSHFNSKAKDNFTPGTLRAAACYKVQLDTVFDPNLGGSVTAPSKPTDGQTFALLHLGAAGFISHQPGLGFEKPEDEEMFKKCGRPLPTVSTVITPTKKYVRGLGLEDFHDDAGAVTAEPPGCHDPERPGIIPIWRTISGALIPGIWENLVCLILRLLVGKVKLSETRITKELKGKVERIDVETAIEWLVGHAVLEDTGLGDCGEDGILRLRLVDASWGWWSTFGAGQFGTESQEAPDVGDVAREGPSQAQAAISEPGINRKLSNGITDQSKKGRTSDGRLKGKGKA